MDVVTVETVIKNQLYEYFNSNNLFSDSQFGFISGKSTVKAVETLVNEVLLAFENRQLVCTTLVDLSKAFDSISHPIILEKLKLYGVENTELNLLKSYLENRKQMVVVGNEKSKIKDVQLGVPQGSILGPLLFVIFINDLPSYMCGNTILYADDTTFYGIDSDHMTAHLKVQDMLKRSHSWFNANSLKVNEGKTENIIFNLKKTEIEKKTIKLLGIFLDNKLNWEAQTANVVTRLSRVLFLLRKLRSCVSRDVLITAYFAFFHPHLLYGIRLWGNSPGAKHVFVCQKKAIRILMGVKSQESCSNLFQQLRIMTVPSLYIYCNLLHVKENLGSFTQRLSIHEHSTRNHSKLDLPSFRLSKCTDSHLYLQYKLFNKLPISAIGLSIGKFKTILKHWLMSKAFYKIEDYLNNSMSDLKFD